MKKREISLSEVQVIHRLDGAVGVLLSTTRMGIPMHQYPKPRKPSRKATKRVAACKMLKSCMMKGARRFMKFCVG